MILADPPAPFCPNCGTATSAHPTAYQTRVPRTLGVSAVGFAASALLICDALAQFGYGLTRLTDHDTESIALISALLEIATLLVFVTWFYRSRVNAGLWGPQRHSQGWAVASWIVPVVSLWFPFQMMNDIWRASTTPAEQRRRPDLLVQAWWGCLVLAMLSGISITNSTAVLPDGSIQKHVGFNEELGGSLISNLAAILAAVFGVAVVTKLTRMQKARLAA